jgi:(p)ppGpp synthase/HD superfamily hydrolase
MINEAFLFAYQAHKGQVRKDGLPYIAHPVEVAMELARNGADEPLIAAGYLHDTIEDANVTQDQLMAKFGKEVTDLVAKDSEDKSKSWEERKEETLQQLHQPNDKNFKMLICADKLSNLRSLKEALKKDGDATWSRFKRGPEKQAWLYREIVKALASLDGMPMYEELRRLTDEIFKD